MTRKNINGLIVIFLFIFFPSIIGIIQIFSVSSNQIKHPYQYYDFDDWKNFLLIHNNIEPDLVNNLNPETISNLNEQINIYYRWSNRIYSREEKIQLLKLTLNTPYIRYLGPNNHPIEGIDLKSFDDELFEIDFRIDDNTINEWVLRVYAYLDFDTLDTSLTNSENFQDGSASKHFLPGSQPTPQELNPDENFMGEVYTMILENFEQFTQSEKDFTARQVFPGYVDNNIYFHVKILYQQDIFEADGWHSYYYYRTFYISWYWTQNFKQSDLKIIDDDIVPPKISEISILNSPIYDNYDNIIFDLIAEDQSGISELYIEFMENEYYFNENGQIVIPNPRFPGSYNLFAIAVDADIDREGDKLITIVESNFEVYDDDITPPQIIISEDESGWNISISDDDGITDSIASGNFSLNDQDGNILATGVILQEGNSCYISKEVIPLKIGVYTLEVYATNNDLEWLGDEEISYITEEISITLEDCYNYVIQQIETLKEYIGNNLCCILACILNKKLSLAQECLIDAYSLTMQGNINCALISLRHAKFFICLVKCFILCLMKCHIPNDIGNYIIQSLYDIKNNIILLMEISADYVSQFD
ncbi:MAG: hypothetical protein ACFE8J_01400 [Candidatus Heimdallarchaeota archaeon]